MLTPEFEDVSRDEVAGALKEQVRHVIGPIATPDRIQITPGLPKTRSGKIMRRILRKIAEGSTMSWGMFRLWRIRELWRGWWRSIIRLGVRPEAE